MADTLKFVQAQNFSLAGSGAVIGATTIILKSFAGIDGALLTMTDFGSIGFGTLEPGNGTLEEQISFTGVTQNSNGTATLTGVSSVIFIAPYTQTSGLLKTHAGSTTFVISNTAGFYDELSGKSNDETITGTWTFPSADPTRAGIGSDTDTAVATAFVTLGQLSRQAISGASNASTTVKGIVELATQAELDARTTTGGTGALLVPTPNIIRAVLTHDSATSAVGTDAYAITLTPAVTAYTTGDVYYFKADVANTGACTLNVSGLGAKTLLTNKGLTPPDNYIAAGAMVQCMYDGTNMQILSVGSTSQLSQSIKEIYGASVAGTDTYAITVQPTPIAYAAGQVYIFKADVANTTTASLNVNSLGALNILRSDGSALQTNDIVANQIVEVAVYDGSTAKMLSPIPATIYKNGTNNSRDGATASGSQTIAHGLGVIPKRIRITASCTQSGASFDSLHSDGVYNGTTTSCLWYYTSLVSTDTADNGIDSTNLINLGYGGNSQVATVAFDATNITLTWTKAGSGATSAANAIELLWEAQT